MRIGFIGLGDMGQAIVPRLLPAGHTVMGWNGTKQKADPMFKLGMLWADSPREAARESEVVSTPSLFHWKKPAAEPEIVVHLGKDLPSGSDRPMGGTFARNIYERHVILGRNDGTRAGGILDRLTCRVLQNGSELADVTGCEAQRAQTGELCDIVRHVADLLAAFGETLQARQIIIAGSIIPPIWVEAGEERIFNLTPGDTISIRCASQPSA